MLIPAVIGASIGGGIGGGSENAMVVARIVDQAHLARH